MRRRAKARTRVAIAFAVGAAAGLVALTYLPWQVAVLVGWGGVALTILVWVLPVVLSLDGPATAHAAMREDDSRVAADLLIVGASLASLVGVAFGLIKGASEKGGAEAAITAVAVVSVVLSWAIVQVTYTLRYARLYYAGGGGIEFNGEDETPDFRDFAYLAVTIGMTYQVSDTDLKTKEFRRTVTRHALLSYLFGTVVVAMTINVVAGLVK